MNKKNIVLIGFMGTGKTTIGKIISEKLGCIFFDTDYEIEKRCGISINDIFTLQGEKYFRDLESEVVYEISGASQVVISCGGGVVKNDENIKNLKRNGIIICLTADAETVYRRIINQNDRPLIKGMNIDDISRLINERKKLYTVADIFIDTTNDSPLSVADKLLDIIISYE